MRSVGSFIALNRFGVGAAPGDEARMGDDPRGWLLAQIRPDAPLPHRLREFRSSDEIITGIYTARFEGAEARREAVRQAMGQDFRAELLARARNMTRTEGVLAERMVQFWSNHFTVSLTRGARNGAAIAAYEREAIRPHIFGRFADMLRAVARHPSMLDYLDNTRSVGPESPAGQRRRETREIETTLNENFARELLELHTLGVDGGYAQADVVQTALILTGWSHGGYRRGGDERVHGRFQFVRRQHQPGDKTVLGVTYPEAGEEEGLSLLADLARHPSTARHIALKLARHFIADDPPDAAVAQLARVFQDTDGDLAQVTAALISLDEAWADPLAKVKSHHDFIIALHRASGLRLTRETYFQPLNLLGAYPFSAPSPAGWGDRAEDWLGPESLMIRLEFARAFAGRLPGTLIPAEVMEATIGPVAPEVTQTWVHRAPSGDAGLAMIFSSPEFQRR
ncbi:DUF1800 family protein [Pararhodobacter sp. CCB-MM2]|uniref:DUF1800 domain-containing protein n=1 Tax=Pararhodobacter sp. CCB-MM2 TaxID=1786003 RepID=UPI000B143337|nr:DUF1800 domain-containing protein [Pararhodobacter sp. CCB-MM2]